MLGQVLQFPTWGWETLMKMVRCVALHDIQEAVLIGVRCGQFGFKHKHSCTCYITGRALSFLLSYLYAFCLSQLYINAPMPYIWLPTLVLCSFFDFTLLSSMDPEAIRLHADSAVLVAQHASGPLAHEHLVLVSLLALGTQPAVENKLLPCHQLCSCIIIVRVFLWKPNDEANRVHAENRCSYFYSDALHGKDPLSLLYFHLICFWLKGSWERLKKIMLSFQQELGTGLEGVWSRHPWHFIIHLFPEDIILFLVENCLGTIL